MCQPSKWPLAMIYAVRIGLDCRVSPTISVCHLLHFGLSAPEGKRGNHLRSDLGLAYPRGHHEDVLSPYGKSAEFRRSTPINSAIPGIAAVAVTGRDLYGHLKTHLQTVAKPCRGAAHTPSVGVLPQHIRQRGSSTCCPLPSGPPDRSRTNKPILMPVIP